MAEPDHGWRLTWALMLAVPGCVALIYRQVCGPYLAVAAAPGELVIGLLGLGLLTLGALLASDGPAPPGTGDRALPLIMAGDVFALPGGRAWLAMAVCPPNPQPRKDGRS